MLDTIVFQSHMVKKKETSYNGKQFKQEMLAFVD